MTEVTRKAGIRKAAILAGSKARETLFCPGPALQAERIFPSLCPQHYIADEGGDTHTRACACEHTHTHTQREEPGRGGHKLKKGQPGHSKMSETHGNRPHIIRSLTSALIGTVEMRQAQ